MRSDLDVFPDLPLIGDVVLRGTGVVIADPSPELCRVVWGVPSKSASQNPGANMNVQAPIVDDLLARNPHAGKFWQVHRVHLGRPHVITAVRVPADAANTATFCQEDGAVEKFRQMILFCGMRDACSERAGEAGHGSGDRPLAL